MKLAGTALLAAVVAAVVVGVVCSEYARRSPAVVAGDGSRVASGTPSAAAGDALPSVSPRRPVADAAVTGPGGLTVRYLDDDGQIKQLDVKDFGH